ncbi:MAG: hypothetical protein F6K16_32750 [Symploca sp. SIO2B6]|nr:hypothetical protein [Symploca sp. SIO2B6]
MQAKQSKTGIVIWVGGAIAIGLLAFGIIQYTQARSTSTTQVNEIESQPTPPQRTSVVALGRIEPEGEVIRVSGPTGDRIRRLDVKEGEQVTSGQVWDLRTSRFA